MKKKIRNFTYWLEIAALGIVLGLIIQGARAWTEPTTDPPNGNVGAPINTSANTQLKAGIFVANSSQWTITDPLKIVDNPGLLIGGKAQADDFCLTDDKTRCLSNAQPMPACHGQQIFITSGTFNVPDCTSSLTVDLYGGGGGGGGGGGAILYLLNTQDNGGHGGHGGGGYANSQTLTVTPGDAISVTVGNGGSAGGGGASVSGWSSTGWLCGSNGGGGGNGGTSSFGSYVSASGGGGAGGGTAACRDSSGNGYNGSNGSNGSPGANGTSYGVGGSGGSGGNTSSNGSSGSSGTKGGVIVTW